LLFGLLLGIGALWAWRREIAHSAAERRLLARRRAGGYAGIAGAVLALLFTGAAISLYQQEQHPDNQLPGDREQQKIMAQFRQQFGHLAQMAQPRICRMNVAVDIYPEQASFRARGHYTLINKTNKPIDTLLVKAGYDELTQLSFSMPATVVATLPALRFSLYQLQRPLAPGDSIRLQFDVRNRPNTWLTRHSPVLPNGTYLKSDIFPRLGYFANASKPPPTDSAARANHYQGQDADVIDFEAIVSTSAPQTALAPGRLLQQWESRGRRYFHYRTDTPIKFVLGFNSGIYQVLRAKHRGVNLAIWHHPGHPHCLPSIMRGLKAALDYNITHFGPYPFTDLSVVEFARTEGSYATTAANVIPMSEIRFVQDIETGGKSPDLAFYVAAHELSHQWWGNQLMPADALGALMLTESLAEYTTAKVYEKTFGKAAVKPFLDIQHQRYLSGRAAETGPETRLAYVAPEQAYLAYGKGAVAFYALSERMGERQFNGVLRAFLEQYKNQGPPYPTSLDLLGRLPPLD
jgi:ABC-2 type transport system permease protein